MRRTPRTSRDPWRDDLHGRPQRNTLPGSVASPGQRPSKMVWKSHAILSSMGMQISTLSEVLMWASVFAVVGVGAAAAVGIGAHRRNRRILRRGVRMTAEIVAADVAPGNARSERRNVRLQLRFEGVEEHVLDFIGYRLRAADAAALAPGVRVQAWVLPDDGSEIRVAHPGEPARILALQAAPEVSGKYPDGTADGIGSVLFPDV
ncbi:hypothetical protein [Dactylosporangium maewongense]